MSAAKEPATAIGVVEMTIERAQAGCRLAFNYKNVSIMISE